MPIYFVLNVFKVNKTRPRFTLYIHIRTLNDPSCISGICYKLHITICHHSYFTQCPPMFVLGMIVDMMEEFARQRARYNTEISFK